MFLFKTIFSRYTKNGFAQSKDDFIQSVTAWYSVLCSVKCCTNRGLFKTPLRPLAATVTEAETCQLCSTTGTSPSWRGCLYCDISRQCWTKGAQPERNTDFHWPYSHSHLLAVGAALKWDPYFNRPKIKHSNGWNHWGFGSFLDFCLMATADKSTIPIGIPIWRFPKMRVPLNHQF